jgi:hypothetical protein
MIMKSAKPIINKSQSNCDVSVQSQPQGLQNQSQSKPSLRLSSVGVKAHKTSSQQYKCNDHESSFDI